MKSVSGDTELRLRSWFLRYAHFAACRLGVARASRGPSATIDVDSPLRGSQLWRIMKCIEHARQLLGGNLHLTRRSSKVFSPHSLLFSRLTHEHESKGKKAARSTAIYLSNVWMVAVIAWAATSSVYFSVRG